MSGVQSFCKNTKRGWNGKGKFLTYVERFNANEEYSFENFNHIFAYLEKGFDSSIQYEDFHKIFTTKVVIFARLVKKSDI